MIDFEVDINAKAFLKDCEEIVEKEIPFALSKAMEKTVKRARALARLSAKRELHNPRKSTLNAIRARWPSKTAIKRGNVEAAVFIADFLVDELHPIICGGLIENTSGGRDIITPVNMKVNEAGNIGGLRSKRLTRLRQQTDKYINIPLGVSSNLPPGLYRKYASGRLVMLLAYSENRQQRIKWKSYHRTIITTYEKLFSVYFFEALNKYGAIR